MLNNSIQKFASTAEIYEQKLKVLIFFLTRPVVSRWAQRHIAVTQNVL